jgi:hypothetical protein
MALTVYGFRDRPHDFAVTKVGADLGDCAFVLDFNRTLQRIRWFGSTNRWLGPTVGLLVPVIHQGQEYGEFVIGLHRGEPYFLDIPAMWRKHRGTRRSICAEAADGIEIVVDFGRHFPEDCSR